MTQEKETYFKNFARKTLGSALATEKKTAGKRAYAALWENAYHADSCLLTPVMMGERRWDGKNKGVSIEDSMFLAARDPNKW